MSIITTPFSPRGPARTPGLGRRRESRRPGRMIAAVIAAGAVCLALAVRAPAAGASTTFTAPALDVGIIPFTGDVYALDQYGNLIPVLITSTSLSAPLYNEAGDPLNVTWGQFSSATAKSYAWTDTLNGVTHTDFLIRMSGLIPDGVYSLFYRTFSPDSNNAYCPDVEPTVALTSVFPRLQKPDPDSFSASSSGTALFIGRVAGNLLAEAQGPAASLGGLCGSSYGIDAMRQFIIIQK